MPVQMLNDFVLVKQIEEKSSGSDLIMVDSSSSSCKKMRIAAISIGGASKGDTVFVPQTAHMQSITVDGEQFFCVRWQEIVAIEKARV